MEVTFKRTTSTQGICQHLVLHELARSILQLYTLSSANRADRKPS